MSPNALSAEEVIEEIRRIQEVHGQNLEVRVTKNQWVSVNASSVVEIKYRSSGGLGVVTPYIELVIA